MMIKYLRTSNHISFIHILIIVVILIFPKNILGQYSKNPLLDITNEGYIMVVEKYVKIPDDDGVRPRINCINYFHNRLFATTETGGKIYEIITNNDGTHSARLFFNVKEAIPLNTGRQLVATGNWHSGLRSVAFHPDFLNNGKFYTSLMEERPADTSGHHYLSDVSNPIEADGVVVEWTYNFETDTVDEMSYRELFRIGIPQFDHPMKQLDFNNNAKPGDEDYGLLYIGHGDGNLYNTPQNGGQSNDGRGKILRINPLQTDSTPYSIPPGNPFINNPDWLDEIFATGFRNPHSLCFTKDGSGNDVVIVGNAGRDNIEEVEVVRKGENHGWSLREGTYVHLQIGGVNTGIAALPDNDADFGFTYPAAQWSHSAPIFSNFGGKSIVGGYIYTIPESGEKIYLSADFPESGLVMYNNLDELFNAKTKLDPDNPDLDQPQELTQAPFKILNVYFDDDNNPLTPPVARDNMLDVFDDEPSFDNNGRADLRFGHDSSDNIYISSKRNGWIYKIQSITKGSFDPVTYHKSDFNDLKIYPNPVKNNGVLSVLFNSIAKENIHLTLISPDGRQILQKTSTSGKLKLDIELNPLNIKSGVYLLRINSPTYNSTFPVVIE
jgi:hypothetical protein